MTKILKERWMKIAGVIKEQAEDDVEYQEKKAIAIEVEELNLLVRRLDRALEELQDVDAEIRRNAGRGGPEVDSNVYDSMNIVEDAIDTLRSLASKAGVELNESSGIDKDDKKNIDEAQFAKDALEDIDTRWQPHSGEDYEIPGKDFEADAGIPTMIGSVQDEEFSLDDFDPEEEDLTTREPDYESDPEYDEDKLGDLYGLSWEEAEEEREYEQRRFGGPSMKDTDIGRKS